MLGTNQKLTGNQYAQMGQAVAQGGMQAYQTSQTPGLSEYEKNQQYGKSIKSAETGVVSAINPIFGMIHSGVTAATAPLTAKATQTDEQGNLKNKNFAKADIIGQGFADPMAMIPTMISNKFSMKKYINSVEDNAKGKIAAQKAQEDAYAQQQTDYQNQQQSMMDAAFARGYANQNQTGGNTYVQYAKYGGQMKFAMGGMNKYPGGGMGEGNGQVELDENSVAPNGQFTQFNEPSHDVQNPNQPNASFDPGEKIFSAKLKIGNKTIADLNKANNTNREDKLLKDSTLGKTSALSLQLTKMAKMKNSDVLFAMQEQLKKDKVAAYAKKMGVEIPSMDNQQMSPQGMPGQPQGKMPIVRHGGMFAMGGVQLPYYNTDNAGNPIYAMGGGYPAMTNPYNNFRGSIPMYDDGGNMPEDPLTTTPTTNGTTPINLPLKLSEVPSYGKTGYKESNAKVKDRKIEMYNNPDYLIQHQNIDGTKWNDFQKFMSTYKLPNGQNFVGNEDANTNLSNNYTDLVMSDYNKTLSQKYKDNPDEATRRSISLGDLEEVQKYYNQGDPDLKVDRILGGEATQLKIPHWSSVSKSTLKPNEYMPITFGGKKYVVDANTYNTKFKGAWEGTSNENLTKYFQPYDPKKHMNINDKNVEVVNRLGTVPGGSGPFVKEQYNYPTFTFRNGYGTMAEQKQAYRKENNLPDDFEFKYGGQMQMPKFWGGGPYIDPSETGMQEQADMNAYYDSLNQINSANNTGQGFKVKGMGIPSNSPLKILPKLDFSKYGAHQGGLNVKQPSNEDLRRQTFGTSSGSETLPGADPNSKNFDWGNLAMQGANFLGQNAGNIYDLTRKNEPLETYDLMTAKYMDPTQAIAGENYIGRQTKNAIPRLVGGNAGAAMNLLGANKANTATRIGRLLETYDNANAQIGNQVNQYNTGIKKDQAVARAANAAALENVRSQAVHSIGSNFGKMTKSGKQDNMDQDTLKMFQWRYKNEPGFKKYIDNFSTQNNSEEAIG
jgi:hypothetical protein